MLRSAVAVGVAATTLSGCYWVSYGFGWDNARDAAYEQRISPATAPALEELWRVDGTVGATSTPAVLDGVVYFAAWDGTLRAVSAADGSPVWTTRLGSVLIDDSPLLYRDLLYVGDGAGNLHAVDRATGALRWTVELDPHPLARTFSSPVGVDGLVIVGVASVELALPLPDYTFRGSVVALDAETGEERWRLYTTTNDETAGAGVSVWSSVAVDRRRRLVFHRHRQHLRAPGRAAQRLPARHRLPHRRAGLAPPVHRGRRVHDLRPAAAGPGRRHRRGAQPVPHRRP